MASKRVVWPYAAVTAIGDRLTWKEHKNLNQLDDGGWLALGEAYWAVQRWDDAVKTWTPLMEQHRAPVETYQRAVNFRLLTGWVKKRRAGRRLVDGIPARWSGSLYVGAVQPPFDESGAKTALKRQPNWTRPGQPMLPSYPGPTKSRSGSPPESRLVEIGRALGSVGEWNLALISFEKAADTQPAVCAGLGLSQ